MWKATPNSVLILSLTTRVAPNGLSPLWCLTFDCGQTPLSCVFFFGLKEVETLRAHEAAKYTLLSGFSFSSGPSNLPTSVALACKEDAPAVFVSSCL